MRAGAAVARSPDGRPLEPVERGPRRRRRRVLPEARGQAGDARLFAEKFPLAQRPPKPFQQGKGLGGRPGRFQLLEGSSAVCALTALPRPSSATRNASATPVCFVGHLPG